MWVTTGLSKEDELSSFQQAHAPDALIEYFIAAGLGCAARL